MELALSGMKLKSRYKHSPFDFQSLGAGVLIASDTSSTGESGSRSQQGRIHFLLLAGQILNPQNCDYDVATLQAESLQYHENFGTVRHF